MFFVVGILLFSSTVLLPQFLQTLMGYTAQKAGMVLSVAAILLLILLQNAAVSQRDSRLVTSLHLAGSPLPWVCT